MPLRPALPPVLAVLVVAAGCASSGSEVPQAGERQRNINIRTSRSSGTLNLRSDEDLDVVRDTLPGSPGDLFALLPGVYSRLGIPITTVNTGAKALGTVEYRARDEFAGDRISKWLDCGTSITGDIADEREIYVTALTQLHPVEGERAAAISIYVKGYASKGSVSGNLKPCRSRSRLEQRIRSELVAAAGEAEG